MEKILILDNYDSFTYNIVHLLHELGAEVDIARNDRISVEEAGRYNRIILSPAPGHNAPVPFGRGAHLRPARGRGRDALGV